MLRIIKKLPKEKYDRNYRNQIYHNFYFKKDQYLKYGLFIILLFLLHLK